MNLDYITVRYIHRCVFRVAGALPFGLRLGLNEIVSYAICKTVRPQRDSCQKRPAFGGYWPFCFRAIVSRIRSAFGSSSEAGVELPKENLLAGVVFHTLADFEPRTSFRFASANGAIASCSKSRL